MPISSLTGGLLVSPLDCGAPEAYASASCASILAEFHDDAGGAAGPPPLPPMAMGGGGRGDIPEAPLPPPRSPLRSLSPLGRGQGEGRHALPAGKRSRCFAIGPWGQLIDGAGTLGAGSRPMARRGARPPAVPPAHAA